MEPRVSLVTLGVADLEKARQFYTQLGWVEHEPRNESVAFYQSGSSALALWNRDQLTEDTAVEDPGGYGGVTLAYNVASPADVDAFLAKAESAGAEIVRPAKETFWGGYSGVFVDPDGHPWEVAHNPFWKLDPDGAIHLNG